MRAAFAHEELDVADDPDARSMGEIDRPVRLRMGERHARRKHEGGKSGPFDGAQVRRQHARGGSLGDAVRVVVPGGDVRAAGHQRLRRCEPRAAEPEESDLFALECADRDHRPITAA
ncbi:hypothetical protein D9M72_427160 [compost metagenome]